MTTIELCLCVCWTLLLVALATGSYLRRAKERKMRTQLRKLELVLLPKETVKAICPQKKGRYILTSRRVLLETKEGFTALLLKDIQKVQGLNEKGNRTTSVPKMTQLVIKGEQEYTVANCCGEFEEFARQLMKKTQKKKKSTTP